MSETLTDAEAVERLRELGRWVDWQDCTDQLDESHAAVCQRGADAIVECARLREALGDTIKAQYRAQIECMTLRKALETISAYAERIEGDHSNVELASCIVEQARAALAARQDGQR